MLKKILSLPVLTGFLFVPASVIRAETVSQDFAGDALTNGWSIVGDASLFVWDSTNQNLRVTWDSTKTNSYFLHPLGTTVTRHDDFQIEFDLLLTDCISGHEPGKTGPMQIGIGLFSHAVAAAPGFGRTDYGGAPNIAEFNYFPYGYYTFGMDVFPSPATAVGDFISSSGYEYAPTFFSPNYEFEWPTNQFIRVAMEYTARNQSLALTLTTNGVVIYHPPDVVLSNPGNSGFTPTNNFFVDTFSISSYGGHNELFSSVLGHGVVDNIHVFVPPVQDFTGTWSNNVWATRFRSRTNWSYTLERTTNLSSWVDVSATVSGSGTNLFFEDANRPAAKAFYRVRASRP
jgi:hypothetical protein